MHEIYSVEYRPLQHAPFPAVVQDAEAVYTHVVKQYDIAVVDKWRWRKLAMVAVPQKLRPAFDSNVPPLDLNSNHLLPDVCLPSITF